VLNIFQDIDITYFFSNIFAYQPSFGDGWTNLNFIFSIAAGLI